MNNRERALAILNYQAYDRMPLVHFGFWRETLQKWVSEGHLTEDEIRRWGDGTPADARIAQRLGLDCNWGQCFAPLTGLFPPIEEKVLEQLPGGSRKFLNRDGAIVIQKDGAFGIPSEVDHLLKGRKEWDEHFQPRLAYRRERITGGVVGINFPFSADKTVTYPSVNTGAEMRLYGEGGLDYLREGQWTVPYGLYCGSLYGLMRDWVGLVGLSYLQVDDPGLHEEMIRTVADLCYECVKAVLANGVRLDFAHFWEDICFRGGPLVNPRLFRSKVGVHYRRITELLRSHGMHIISLDCDGWIDDLVPIWLENGVNTMFPIEVGVWNGNIRPWREKYGRELRGVGGMDKKVFAHDYAAIDAEIERLKPLVDLGGYIPCPDHRIPPDAKWENVQYYCEKMHKAFGG